MTDGVTDYLYNLHDLFVGRNVKINFGHRIIRKPQYIACNFEMKFSMRYFRVKKALSLINMENKSYLHSYKAYTEYTIREMKLFP